MNSPICQYLYLDSQLLSYLHRVGSQHCIWVISNHTSDKYLTRLYKEHLLTPLNLLEVVINIIRTFFLDLFMMQASLCYNIKRDKQSYMASVELHLSWIILAFLSNQINLIKDKTHLHNREFPFGRVPKLLKEIHHLSYAFRRNLKHWLCETIFAEVLVQWTVKKSWQCNSPFLNYAR